MMKMKYITPEITVVEAAVEADILAASGEGESHVGSNSKWTDEIQVSEEVDLGAKSYSGWDTWDE